MLSTLVVVGGLGITWTALAVAVGVAVGRAIHRAEARERAQAARRHPSARHLVVVPDHVPDALVRRYGGNGGNR
jgi:hypothetical protein